MLSNRRCAVFENGGVEESVGGQAWGDKTSATSKCLKPWEGLERDHGTLTIFPTLAYRSMLERAWYCWTVRPLRQQTPCRSLLQVGEIPRRTIQRQKELEKLIAVGSGCRLPSSDEMLRRTASCLLLSAMSVKITWSRTSASLRVDAVDGNVGSPHECTAPCHHYHHHFSSF